MAVRNSISDAIEPVAARAPLPACPAVSRVSVGDQRWRVREGWEHVLLDDDGFRLGQWLKSAAVKVVRDRGRRAVYRVELQGPSTGEGQAVFVKHDRCRGWGDVLRILARGSAARREWKRVEEALRRGVATAWPIAWGEQIRHSLVRDSFLVSEEIANAQPLDRFVAELEESLNGSVKRRRRRELIEGLARFVAALHEAGVLHGDFHAGNILVQTVADEPRFFLIDLAAAKFGRSPMWKESRENLTVLNAEWFDRSTFGQRWRFWKTYLRSRPGLDAPASAEVVRQLDLASRRYSQRIDRRRDRRAMQTNGDFYIARLRESQEKHASCAGHAHAVRDLPQAVLEKMLSQPDAMLLENLHRPIKLGHASMMVRATIEMADCTREIAYKRCRPRNAWKAFCDRFRTGRAERGWRIGHALLSRGIATPRPLAVCVIEHSPQGPAGYLATEWVEGATNLHLWAWRLAEKPLVERLRQATRCAESLGRLVGRMHAKRISHGDLKGGNVLVVERGSVIEQNQSLETLLIDLDGVRIGRGLSRKRQVADLMRLATSVAGHSWVNHSIRRRFLAAYENQFPQGAVCWKSLWRQVSKRSKKLIERKHKRGEDLL